MYFFNKKLNEKKDVYVLLREIKDHCSKKERDKGPKREKIKIKDQSVTNK